MPTFSEEGWAPVCHRKLPVNLPLFLGAFLDPCPPQKSEDNAPVSCPAWIPFDFSFFSSFFVHAPKMLLPLQWGVSPSSISHSFTFLGLIFGRILLLSPLNGTRAKDNYIFISSTSLFCFVLHFLFASAKKSSFSTRGSVCVHLLSSTPQQLCFSWCSSFLPWGL